VTIKMARYSKTRINEFIARVRALLVRKPDLSLREIQALLEAHPTESLHLQLTYIGKLVNKIRKEREERMNHHTVNKVLATFHDEAEEIKNRLWMIATDPKSTKAEVIAALRELRNTSKDVMDSMFNAGVFERQLGKMKIEGKLDEKQEERIKDIINHVFRAKPKENTGE